MKKSLNILTIMLVAVAMVVVFCGPAAAKVTGVCSGCHTMHDSQGGSAMATLTGGPHATLLMNDCVGCHTGENSGGISSRGDTPYVMDTSAPNFGDDTLAGGNFWWVSSSCVGSDCGDAKGHNVFGISSQDVAITVDEGAPGDGKGCGGDSCHNTLALETASPYSGPPGSAPGGCQGCHLDVQHHANDGTGTSTKYVGEAPWYRFLAGHQSGPAGDYGVKGIEVNNWQNESESNHNEYLGIPGNTSLLSGGNMTAFCCGCHGNFHENTGSPWIRHPSDYVIPTTGEYADMSTIYNPDVPVARTGAAIAGFEDHPSHTVAAGEDMVMCLSCHMAHGSLYDDMLRWNPDHMVAGGDTKTGGCFVCHTKKDTGG